MLVRFVIGIKLVACFCCVGKIACKVCHCHIFCWYVGATDCTVCNWHEARCLSASWKHLNVNFCSWHGSRCFFIMRGNNSCSCRFDMVPTRRSCAQTLSTTAQSAPQLFQSQTFPNCYVWSSPVCASWIVVCGWQHFDLFLRICPPPTYKMHPSSRSFGNRVLPIHLDNVCIFSPRFYLIIYVIYGMSLQFPTIYTLFDWFRAIPIHLYVIQIFQALSFHMYGVYAIPA